MKHPETLNKTAGFSAKTMLQNLIPILAQAPAGGGFLAGLSKALGLIRVSSGNGQYSVNGILFLYSEFRKIPSMGSELALRLGFIGKNSEY